MSDSKRIIVGAIVVDHQDRIFMHLRDDKPTIAAPGHWSIFGGSLEPGESTVQGVQRELFEELAIRAEESEFELFRLVDIPEKRYYIYHVNVGERGDQAVLGEGQAFERFTPEALAAQLETGKIGDRPVIPWVKETVLQFIYQQIGSGDGRLSCTLSLEPSELTTLAARFGPSQSWHYHFQVNDPFLTGNHQLLTSNRRRAEICYIMHRGDPNEGVLLHIKTIYPPGAYRLPTGGIHQGESVLDTLVREVYEETGLRVGETAQDVQLQRYLGVVSYEMDQVQEARQHTFATYHFLLQMPKDAELNPQDEEELLGGWQWQPASTLNQVADFLATLGQTAPEWSDWGKFRALSHRFVWEQMRVMSDE